MSRVSVNVVLKKDNDIIIDKNCLGIFSNNIVKYNDDCINVYDFSKNILKRKCSDYEIVLDFNQCSGKYIIDNYVLPLDIDVIFIEVSSNSLYVKYKLMSNDENLFEYFLKLGE